MFIYEFAGLPQLSQAMARLHRAIAAFCCEQLHYQEGERGRSNFKYFY
jgi:hypothetical protein